MMNKIPLLILFPVLLMIARPGGLYAQATPSVDSLQQIARDGQQPDSVRLQALRALQKQFSTFDADRALTSAQEELALAQTGTDSSAVSKAYHNLLHRYLQIWQNPEAADTTRLQVMAYLIDDHVARGSDSLVSLIEAQMAFAEARDNLKWQGRAWRRLADYYASQPPISAQSEEAYQRAWDFSQRARDSVCLTSVLFNLGNFYNQRGQFGLADSVFAIGQSIAEQRRDTAFLDEFLNNRGISLARLGNYQAALAQFKVVLALRSKGRDTVEIAGILTNIGNIYQNLGNFPEALAHFRQSQKLCEAVGERLYLVRALNSIGISYKRQENYAEARRYFMQALELSQGQTELGGGIYERYNLAVINSAEGDTLGALANYAEVAKVADSLGNSFVLASALRAQAGLLIDLGRPAEAEGLALRSLEMIRANQQGGSLASTLVTLADSYKAQDRLPQAVPLYEEAMVEARKVGNVQSIQKASQSLAEVYQHLGRYREAYEMLELRYQMRDSIRNADNERLTIQQEYQYQYEKQALADSISFAKAAQIKDLQIAEQQASLGQQRIALGAVVLGLILIGALAYAIFRGKKRSDELLLNILPAETAAELKATGSATTKEYERVSVLFSDFIDFTQLAERLSAAQLVAEINVCFKAFDEIMTQYGMEKIKTIGDAYMAAGGLPDPLGASSRDVVHAGLAMQQFIAARKAEREAAGLPYFEMRVGIHTGPVIAGVVGIKKFQYDVWGDTVNIASRMESHGALGEVNISAATYALLQNEAGLRFQARGAIEVKGKGQMPMYFVRTMPDSSEAEAYLIQKLL